MHDAEDQNAPEIRTQIYKYIQNNPGVYLRKISKELGLAMGQVQYHLSMLEESGQVKSRKISLHRHYYSAEILNEQHKIILAFLMQETARDILIYLMEHQDSTQSDIVNFMQFTAPTISWHMSRMVEAHIVNSRKDGKTTRYSIMVDLRVLASLLKAYHPTIWNKLISRFADLFFDLSSSKKKEEEG